MGGSVLFFLSVNMFMFTMIFWLLMFLTSFFFFKSVNKTSDIFYECGFKAYETLDFKMTSNMLVMAMLLILYDVEFLLLLAIFVNLSSYSFFTIIFIIFIMFMIGFLLYMDNMYLFLYWV